MYIKRHLEPVLLGCLKQYPAVLVTGPRGIGKTDMLKHSCPSFHYADCDDPMIMIDAEDEPFLFLKEHQVPLLLDEIQCAPGLFRYLKMSIDKEKTRGMFVLTGSQAFELMTNSESLAGRMAIIEMEGLSLREVFDIPFYDASVPTEDYLDARKQYLKPYDNLWQRIQRGSMPGLSDPDINWERYYASYVKTYVEKDVRKAANISDEMKFIKFMAALASRAGELLNYNAIAAEVEVSDDTIKKWVSILQTSGIICLLEPYSKNILRSVVKTPKVYFYDSGLLCYLTRWINAEILKAGAKAGNIFENFVVSEILKSHINAGHTLRNYYFYRDKYKKEIDLIIEEGDTLHPVEIKMTGSPVRSMISSFSVLDEIPGKKRGAGALICQYDRLTHLSEDTAAIPVEYI